jgi:hypothetical protein
MRPRRHFGVLLQLLNGSLLCGRCCRAGAVWQGGDEDEERDTEPTPLRRPKRFDDWAADGSGSGRSSDDPWARRRLEGGGGRGIDIEQPTPEQLEQQRRQRQLDVAVKKLEKQGAQARAVLLYHCIAVWVYCYAAAVGGWPSRQQQQRRLRDNLLAVASVICLPRASASSQSSQCRLLCFFPGSWFVIPAAAGVCARFA